MKRFPWQLLKTTILEANPQTQKVLAVLGYTLSSDPAVMKLTFKKLVVKRLT